MIWLNLIWFNWIEFDLIEFDLIEFDLIEFGLNLIWLNASRNFASLTKFATFKTKWPNTTILQMTEDDGNDDDGDEFESLKAPAMAGA